MQVSKKHFESLGGLQDRAAFLRVQRTGRKWVAKGVVVEVAENELGNVRFGLTVSKRISESAVVRNRVRRRLRTAAREVLPTCARSGLDVVLIGRAETADRPFAQIKEDLRWCLDKLGVTRKQV